jgi:hypothetical protein
LLPHTCARLYRNFALVPDSHVGDWIAQSDGGFSTSRQGDMTFFDSALRLT